MNTQVAIQSFLQSCKAAQLRPKTIAWYTHKLTNFSRMYLELPDKPAQIEEFLITIKGEYNVHGYYRTLKAFYRFLRKRYQLPNPIDLVALGLPKNIDKPTLEPDQLFRLLSAIPNSNLRDKTLLTLLLDTGMRASELAGLKKQHILSEEVRVFGKSGWRSIPISAETRRLLMVIVAGNSKDAHVFQGERGPLGRDGVYRIVSKYMKRAGIVGPKLGPHRCRHAFAKTYLMNGGDLRSLQEIMGHSSIKTTEEYLRYANSEVIRKHHMFTPLRTAYAAAQRNFFDNQVIKEAEEILKGERGKYGSEKTHDES